jgi:acetyl esterase/lipase
MKRSAAAVSLLLWWGMAWPALGADQPQVVELWSGNVPDETGTLGAEKVVLSPKLDRKQVEVTESTRMVTNVTQPTLTIYRPAKDRDTGTSVLICPGGGYWNLYWQLEGEEVAAWLNSLGVTGMILKYRVPRRPDEPKGEPARRPLQDAQRAVSLVRSKAKEWGLNPQRIGMVGFSAGGHLAVATATNFDKRTYEPRDAIDQVSCRPDFAIAAYSGYLKAKDKEELAPGLRILAGTPPIFLAHGGADLISSPMHSVVMYLALQRAGVPAELHVYATAAHDFGVRPSDHPCSTWTQACASWLRHQGFLNRNDPVPKQPPSAFTPELVSAGLDQLWTGMDTHYSHFALKPDVDWRALRDRYRLRACEARNLDELTAVLKEMLATLKDGHVWIKREDGDIVGTYRPPWQYNGNRKVILDHLTDTVKCGAFAIVGKTKAEGFGYFLMTQQSAATEGTVAQVVGAIKTLHEVPGFVVDIRMANGGNELFAREIAQRFCGDKVVYAKSKFRNGPAHDAFTEEYPRTLPAAKSGKPYLKPVVCLLGPGCVSSGEGFAQMMRALPHVTTVGLPTRGSSGNPAPVPVGKTGLVVYFSRWVDLLPDGTPIEGKGIPLTVAVNVPAKSYQEDDPTLEKGLEVLRKRVAASSGREGR